MYEPPPEEFFEEMQRIMANYLESLCGIARLYGHAELMGTVMGDKAADVEPGTELQELITNEDYDDLVGWRGFGTPGQHGLERWPPCGARADELERTPELRPCRGCW